MALAMPLAFGFTARLVQEDGRPFSAAPLVVPRTTGDSCLVHSIGLDGKILYSGPLTDYVPSDDVYRHTQESRVTDTCQAIFIIQGYGKITATLHDGAVIVVKHNGDDAEGLAVALPTLQAPPEAHKAWEKGMKALDNRKWPQAEKELRCAVTLYPQYAAAWSGLGEALGEMSRPQDAREAWGRAIQADPNYVKPYVLLARLAVREGRMGDAANITGRALEGTYTKTLPVYYYNAVANLELGQLEAAERSARKAVELDPGHSVPKTEHLLGTVLAARGDRQGAVKHLKLYLEVAPKGEDAQRVKQRIAELEQ